MVAGFESLNEIVVNGPVAPCPRTVAITMTPPAPELNEPEVKVVVATPESSVKTVTG